MAIQLVFVHNQYMGGKEAVEGACQSGTTSCHISIIIMHLLLHHTQQIVLSNMRVMMGLPHCGP